MRKRLFNMTEAPVGYLTYFDSGVCYTGDHDEGYFEHQCQY